MLTPDPGSPARRTRQRFVPEALAGGGAGSFGGGKDDGLGGGGGQGGGGGDGQGGAGDNEEPKKRLGWKGWQDRVAYDPEFPFKVLLEQVRADANRKQHRSPVQGA